MAATPEQAAHYVGELEKLTAQLDAERQDALRMAAEELIRTANELQAGHPALFEQYRAGIDWSIGCLAAASMGHVG
jgi:hypothetical protein